MACHPLSLEGGRQAVPGGYPGLRNPVPATDTASLATAPASRPTAFSMSVRLCAASGEAQGGRARPEDAGGGRLTDGARIVGGDGGRAANSAGHAWRGAGDNLRCAFWGLNHPCFDILFQSLFHKI